MRDLTEARKEARAVLNREYDITAGEIEELHNMNELDKITGAFDLGVTAGAKSKAPDEDDLIELLDKLTPEKLQMVRDRLELFLIENEAEKVKICLTCGSRELSRNDRFIVCDKCGSGGYFRVFDGGDVRLFWKRVEPEEE